MSPCLAVSATRSRFVFHRSLRSGGRLFGLGLVALVVSVLAGAAQAEGDGTAKPDAALRDAVKKFMSIQNTPEIISEQMTYSMADQTLGALAAGGVQITEPMQMIVLDESRKAFGERFGNLEYLTDLYTPIYAQHFTAKELLEVVAFWETPTGRKLMASAPEVNQAFFARLQEETLPKIPEFQQQVDQRLREAGLFGDAGPGAMAPAAP